MLRVITQSQILKRNVAHAAVRPVCSRFLSTDTEHSHKIYALPFKLPEEKVSQIVNIASYVNQHAFLSIFKIIKSVSDSISYLYIDINVFTVDIFPKNARCQRVCFIHAST